MRIIYTCLFVITILFSYAQDTNLSTIRKAYIEANKGENNIVQLLDICQKNKNQEIVNGYIITAEMMLLSYRYNPLKKLELFKQKCKEMDSLVKNNILNLEIRLLRYALQKKSPYLLSYNNQLEEDLEFILSNINNNSIELQEFTLYILNSLENE